MIPMSNPFCVTFPIERFLVTKDITWNIINKIFATKGFQYSLNLFPRKHIGNNMPSQISTIKDNGEFNILIGVKITMLNMRIISCHLLNLYSPRIANVKKYSDMKQCTQFIR